MPRQAYTSRQRAHLERLAAGESDAHPSWLTPALTDPEPHARLANALTHHTQPRPHPGDAPLHLHPSLLPPLG